MAKLPKAFKSADHESANFDPIPAGKYPMMITKSSIEKCKPTAKDPKGQYIKLEITIQGKKFSGRKLFVNLNIVNKSKQTVEIAEKQLGDICRACKKPVIDDTAKIHGIVFIGSVAIEKDNRGKDYPDKNKIVGYYTTGSAKQESSESEEEEEQEEEQEEQEEEQEEQEEEKEEEEEKPKKKRLPWENKDKK